MAVETPRTTGRAAGLAASVRDLASTLVAMLHTRAELFAREFELERTHVTRVIMFGVVAAFFATLGLVALTIFIIVLFWDSYRTLAAGLVTLLYFGIAIGAALYAKREASGASRPFAVTVAELKKDKERLFSGS